MKASWFLEETAYFLGSHSKFLAYSYSLTLDGPRFHDNAQLIGRSMTFLWFRLTKTAACLPRSIPASLLPAFIKIVISPIGVSSDQALNGADGWS